MKTGWTLSVLDKHAKDKTYKLVSGERERALEKRAKYQTQFDAVDEGRLEVGLDSQYSEFQVEGLSKVFFSLNTSWEEAEPELRELLSPFDIFMLEKSGGFEVEIPHQDLQEVTALLVSSSFVSDAT